MTVVADGAVTPPTAGAALLRPGRPCWRVGRCPRLAVLVDGAAYFAAVKRAILAAHRQILVAGWDLDGRIELERERPMAAVPNGLRELLSFVVTRRPGLRVHLLLWDYTVLYATDREPLPSLTLGLMTPDAVEVVFDDSVPVGGSHHEKIVVIDDALAFVGGMDLTARRWDTPEHRPADLGRLDRSGRPYPPVHDVQAMFDGPLAAALGEHVRARWEAAGGDPLVAPEPGNDPWPESVAPAITDIPGGLARTVPPLDGRAGVREVEALYVESIAAAHTAIYIENQYLTSRRVCEALAARLAEPTGPEVVIVSPRRCEGWLEEQVMGQGRARFLARLRAADRFGRLRTCWPSAGRGQKIHVHAKVMVIDDSFARIGSSNLANRSMSVDSECDLALGAETDVHRAAVRAFRDRLLAEHLGCDRERLADATARHGSLVSAIDSLRRRHGRTLMPLEPEAESAEAIELVRLVGDPEQPGDLATIFDRVVGDIDVRRLGVGPLLVANWPLLALVTGVLGLALAWHLTPLGEAVDTATLAAWFADAVRHPMTPLAVVGVYLVAGLVAFPVTMLIAATAIAFGPWEGFAYALGGSLAGAAAGYGVGRLFGRTVVARWSTRWTREVSRRLEGRGFLAVLSVRVIPVAPFTVVNVVVGAFRVPFGRFMVASLVGMAPGIAVMTLLGRRLVALWREPDVLNAAAAVAVLILWLAVGALLYRRLRGDDGERA